MLSGCLLIVSSLLGGCTRGDAKASTGGVAATREAWASQTAQMLGNGLATRADGATLVLPAVEAGDAYTAALALVGAGKAENSIIDEVGRALVTRRVQAATSADELKRSIAGPVATAVALLRADRGRRLLDDAHRSALGRTLEDYLTRQPADVYEASAGLALATSLGRRVDDARERLDAVLTKSPAGCTGSEALFALGAAAEYVHDLSALGCSSAAVTALWDAEAAKADGLVSSSAATPGLGEAEATVALARLSTALPASAARTALVVHLVRSFDTAFESGRVTDAVPVSADLAMAADELSVNRTVSTSVQHYLREVVRGEGDALMLTLDPVAAALLHRTVRAVGSSVQLSIPAMTPLQRLDEMLSDELNPATVLTPADTARLRAAVSGVLAARGPSGSTVFRGLALLGAAACTLPAGLTAASQQVKVAADHVNNGDLASRALAVRVLETCGKAADVANIRGPLVDHAADVLQKTKADGARPSLIEAWQAASVVCALDQTRLRGLDLWASYRELAAPTGGAKDERGAFTDLGNTFDLATLSNPNRDSCATSGVIG